VKYLWKVYKIWIIFGLLFIALTLISIYFLNRFYRLNPPTEITIQDFIYALTGIIILFYTIITWQTLSQLRRSQSLNTLSDLTHYYNQISRARINIFTKQDINVIEEVAESDLTKFSNFLDGFGHITYRLPFEDQNIVIERWAETFIRSWIRLSKFIEMKRPDSIIRDYPFFQWLASKSFEFHRKNYQDLL
jgi:heme/copper-type cytochrome/quinol oxidase subunit 2